MNSNDIFRKSDLGREEIKNQSLGVLPREARTLLIMIDGRKTYQNYIDSLDQSSMFSEFGGVAPLFELLLDFQCIELIDSSHSTSSEQQPSSDNQSISTLSDSNSKNDDEIPMPSATKEPIRSQPQPSQNQMDSEAEFDVTFNKQKPKRSTAISGFFGRRDSNASFETTKSELATYIEKNMPSQEAWGYLLNLEQCNDASQLLALTRDIESVSDNAIARDMDEFFKKIKRQL